MNHETPFVGTVSSRSLRTWKGGRDKDGKRIYLDVSAAGHHSPRRNSAQFFAFFRVLQPLVWERLAADSQETEFFTKVCHDFSIDFWNIAISEGLDGLEHHWWDCFLLCQSSVIADLFYTCLYLSQTLHVWHIYIH